MSHSNHDCPCGDCRMKLAKDLDGVYQVLIPLVFDGKQDEASAYLSQALDSGEVRLPVLIAMLTATLSECDNIKAYKDVYVRASVLCTMSGGQAKIDSALRGLRPLA